MLPCSVADRSQTEQKKKKNRRKRREKSVAKGQVETADKRQEWNGNRRWGIEK